VLGLIRDRDVRWLWHPFASFGSLLGTLWGWQTQRSRGKDRNIHDLRVDQALKPNPNVISREGSQGREIMPSPPPSHPSRDT
jgi:hypothetical protein